MSKMSRAAAALVALVAAATVTARAEIVEQVIVKVNGEILTKTEFEQRQVAAIRQRNVPVASEDDLKKAIADVTPLLIFDTVDELLILQRGHELGYKLDDAQYANIVQQIRKDNKLEDDEKFHAALKQEGMTEADLRRSLEKQMIISRVQGQEVMQKVGITEEEARKYHAEHRGGVHEPRHGDAARDLRARRRPRRRAPTRRPWKQRRRRRLMRCAPGSSPANRSPRSRKQNRRLRRRPTAVSSGRSTRRSSRRRCRRCSRR